MNTLVFILFIAISPMLTLYTQANSLDVIQYNPPDLSEIGDMNEVVPDVDINQYQVIKSLVISFIAEHPTYVRIAIAVCILLLTVCLFYTLISCLKKKTDSPIRIQYTPA